MPGEFEKLPSDKNQARLLGRYAIDFCAGRLGHPHVDVFDQAVLFHLDSVGCGMAALNRCTNAPTILRQEAMAYPAPASARGAFCFGSDSRVKPEKAVLANCSAVREFDANGTNFGYNQRTGQQRGEFGHNDFYPVVMAAAAQLPCTGEAAVLAMICLDEIRGRLAEVFALKDHKIDHVLHGGIASAAVYGAMLGASEEEIESAIGLLVSHYVPFRAIRAGHQLSDSKGASAAITAEMAIQCVHRARAGFVGPADIFRNPQAVFCLFEPSPASDCSPFDLILARSGRDFALMGMHLKLGLYEHQSAGAIQGVIDLLGAYPQVLDDLASLQEIRIRIYEPAFSIIGDPAKRSPSTRQSADHSMVYIVATLLRKAYESKKANWQDLMLLPDDYVESSLFHPTTRSLMDRIVFEHGGAEFDTKYPDGIPTEVQLEHRELGRIESGLVMYPLGHARGERTGLADLIRDKFFRLNADTEEQTTRELYEQLLRIRELSDVELDQLYSAVPVPDSQRTG